MPVTSGRIGDAAHATSEPSRHHERDHGGAGEGESQRGQRRQQDRPAAARGLGQRQGEADEGNLRVMDARRDVQHVDAERRAVALGAADAACRPRRDLRPGELIFQRRERLERLRRIAEHTAVRVDERDPRGDELAHPIGFARQGDRVVAAAPRRSSAAKPGFFDERFLEPRVGLPAHRLGHQQRLRRSARSAAEDSAMRNSFS